MPWRDTASRRLNQFTGGDEYYFCSRVYVNARLTGGFWIPLEVSINSLFFWENQHCRQCWLWERRYPDQAKESANQEAPPTPSYRETNPPQMAEIPEGGDP